MKLNAGSFRDPGGRIYIGDDRVLRSVLPSSANDYEALRDSGLMARLVEAGSLLPASELPLKENSPDPSAVYVLEHPKLSYISYPYEWSFALLKRAALFHLDLQLAALSSGFTLSDATAYNVQFIGTRPVFIDHLSFKPYREGEIWRGHRQFCMQFLNPIILWSCKNVSPAAWFRGSLEGIPPEDLAPLLTWRDNLSWTVLTHVSGQSAMQRRAIQGGITSASPSRTRLSKIAFQGMLEGLRSFIAKCELDGSPTVWGDYEHNNSYEEADAQLKRQFVSDAVKAASPTRCLDLGCNSGDYSEVALTAGAKECLGFDFDYAALDAAVARSDAKSLNFLPLWLDAANPTPNQGWAQNEREGFIERARSDFLLALALIHHIAIGRNVPLDMVIDWLVSLAPAGVIEFPPKSDPMVQQLLANREDIFVDYDEESFLRSVEARASIVSRKHVTPGGRLLVAYKKA